MDLTSPLRSLVPSLDSAVLEVLAGTASGLSATQIARLSRRGTRAGQHAVLNRLVEHGLVIADPANNGFLYRLNRDHLLAPAILTAVRAGEELLSRLTLACQSLSPVPIHVSVFGSHARGQATATSDIDLMLVVDDGLDVHDARWTDQVDDLEDHVLRWTGNRLETMVLSSTRLREIVQAGEPLVETWTADARTLIGPRPQGLVAPADMDA
ncbi:Nucleotidyltransferase domain-containing protein [Sanguibacter gelidistatuariae]|uniref:Nucleotidyltransferase domain-containing protein n=1 Tax=Sanguibacter gelidistatuariae TaxID=1814289 RepID=A0A1G6GMV8_9MICO|nr:nucleotidyltransferase domain-containing protein [Sanguibacter gelidistatuariae]SDB83294.1 Nucleotidyltransferase domain-containing protein [Sanguibacter gelidistatuariae]